ncbi:MAG TPA: ATP-dependent sacrificial sulfur transferase LarE [Candidatus Eisenbacteria bacterium]|nr:ATP-dependent sacrificial sulfur transferase LarE [Candidatus Eisenbacteria bacterium]
MSAEPKVARLRELLGELDTALVAFSGGVDSSFLLRVAAEVLGPRCVALTTVSATTPEGDLDDARRLAGELGVEHVVRETDELAIPGYAENPVDRCYFCKDNLFAICRDEAERRGLDAILDGANLDDLGDHRPGLLAAAEQAVRHPLVEAGLTKADIRAASRELGLASWDRPASPCLSSRFPYGTRITHDGLARVAGAERVLRALGFHELRVRAHDAVARIEVPPDAMARLIDPVVRDAVTAELRRLGFAYVTLDLVGFRSGSLNEVLGAPKHKGPEG